jgi:hypothetical protein
MSEKNDFIQLPLIKKRYIIRCGSIHLGVHENTGELKRKS